MAAAKSEKKMNISIHREKGKISRPGVHSKKKNSVLKTSKHYKKPYAGQGR